jgi:hypothetical protein
MFVSANNAGPFYPGDPVTMAAGGQLARGTHVGTAGLNVVGVVRSVHDANDKPLVFSQPTRGPFLPASTAGFLYVNTDPDMVYLVATETTAAQSMVNRYVSATVAQVCAVSQDLIGRSAFVLRTADVTVSAVGSQFPYKIVGLGPNHLDRAFNNSGGLGTDVEVIIVGHAYRGLNK